MDPLISQKDFSSQTKHDKSIVIIDARSGHDARERYRRGHLAGAMHVHLEEELSDIQEDLRVGGRHPLPSPGQFGRLLGQLGIEPATRVVVYDDKSGASAAARFWWMLRAAGHDGVQVLDGGLQSALAAGLPESIEQPVPQVKPPYPVESWQLPTVNMAEVAGYAQDPRYIVIDVRDENRYKGIEEPIDTIAGHIPGAINMPYTYNLTPAGFFLPAEKLRRMYRPVITAWPASRIIVHCGSGVTACHTLLAFARAGMEIPALYTGSWSEWSRNGKPIAREKG
ncbi:MAG: sulfurtransferase [Bacteroidales bacterium]